LKGILLRDGGAQLLGMTYAQFAAAARAQGTMDPARCAAFYREALRGRTGTDDPSAGASRAIASPPASAAVPLRWTAIQRDPEAVKLSGELRDGGRIETVVIPMRGYATVCVSSQVGCPMGCAFCATARMGFARHLEAAEIVAQVYLARQTLGLAVRNVVFMGMGEPLDNAEAVLQAVAVLSDQRGFDIPRRRITLATVGLDEGLARLGRLPAPGVRLAVSLNAPDDELRNTLMPVNRRLPMDPLRSILKAYPLGPREHIMITYVLIGGVNDRPAQARSLVRFLAPLRVKVNLIPLNPGADARWSPPTPAAIAEFQRILMDRGLQAWRRTPRGQRLMAACGQLAAAAPRQPAGSTPGAGHPSAS
jgi:23S rRNA (adenine2503-C2)-methyltransferase